MVFKVCLPCQLELVLQLTGQSLAENPVMATSTASGTKVTTCSASLESLNSALRIFSACTAAGSVVTSSAVASLGLGEEPWAGS